MPIYPSKEANWSLVPEHIQGALKRYIDRGLEPGSFLGAVLSNDLIGAVVRADAVNKPAIPDIVTFLSLYVPAACWGSKTAYWDWMKRGGLCGSEGADEDE